MINERIVAYLLCIQSPVERLTHVRRTIGMCVVSREGNGSFESLYLDGDLVRRLHK